MNRPLTLIELIEAGAEVVEAPNVLARSNAVRLSPNGLTIFAWSKQVIVLSLYGVKWHDDAEHCRTWSEGCRCDLGDEA